jgi:transmembrane sensor
MSKLEFPLKDSLRDPADEGAVSRMWQGIDARFPRRGGGRSRFAIIVPSIAVAAAAGVALVAFVRHDPGPLRLANGDAIVAVDAPAAGTHLMMSDGSSVELAGGARFEPIESSASTFIAVLERGAATFDVRPGGPRRWQIECGLATVEVVGTRFNCTRGADRLHVGVQHGVVLVRGERVPSRVRRLVAGESLEVLDATAAATDLGNTGHTGNAGNAQIAAPMPPPEPAQPEPASGAGTRAGTGWRELARHGQHREAFAALGPQGIRREAKRLGIADLFALADVARLSGHPTEAVGPLQRIVDGFSHDPQAPLAAFALGRLQLDDLDQPRAAAASLRRALELGAPRSLRDAVRARLEEAQTRIRTDRR